MVIAPPPDVAGPGLIYGILALGAGFLIVLTLLIIVIESAVLQFMRWDTFKTCLKGAALMNLASLIVGFFLLTLIQNLGLFGILIAWALSVIIEALVLSFLKRGEPRKNWLAALAANLVSYLLLILPAYVFGQNY
jgi:hypothetical protein